MPDKFFLEDVNRVSLRNIIAREMISNTLMHREFTSSYMAKFVIEKDQMYVENANRAIGDVFRISVPLDDEYSFDLNLEQKNNSENVTDVTNVTDKTIAMNVVEALKHNPELTTKELAQLFSVTGRTIKRAIATLKEMGLITREGSSRKGKWIIMQ